uniref:hypothetical protein n=1 Tax=Vibrio cholerae TaxID=666 RepID=UPI001C116F53
SGAYHGRTHYTLSLTGKVNPYSTNYYTWGGLGFYAAITFYTDQTYTPSSSTISLLKTGNYHVRIWNENPGAGITGYYQN